MGGRLSYPEADQSGRVAVVTGGNTGIGYETAKGLALLGAHVVVACRSEERATAALERMRAEVTQEHPDKSINVEFMSLDLSSLQSVKKFTEDYKQKGLPLHLLINNAGIAVPQQVQTVDGMESHFHVNHLGPFFLTLEFLPLILSSAPDARIVFVSSLMHNTAKRFDPENLQGEKTYSGQYGNTKALNIMAADALMRRLAGKGVTVSALHPGYVQTDLFRSTTGLMRLAISFTHAVGISRDAKKGAATSLYAAVHPELNKEEFVYYSDCAPTTCAVSCRNIVHQDQLWEVSCNLLKDFLSPDVMREYGPSQPTNSGEEQPPSEQDQQPTSDQQPSSEQDQQPSSEQDQQPSSEQDEQPSPEQDQQPCSEQDQPPTSDQQPSSEQDQQPSSEQDQQPSSEQDQQPSSEQDQQPSSEQDQQPSSEQDQQPSSEQEQQPV